MKKTGMKRRKFLAKAGVGTAAVVAATTVSAPYVKAQKQIKWRLQTYAGAALAEHIIKPAIDDFNKVANGEMVIELFTADQLVPTGELFRAVQKGTLDAVQSDEDSMATPVDLSVFGGYFPLALRYSLDVPVLFNQYGLKEIWEEAYSKIDGVTWLSAGSWDPCHFNTVKPIRSLKDLKGLRIYTFPTAGKFMSKFGVVPVNIPYEDAEVAVQTGELDGMAWSGITEDYTVGWADVTNYFLTNNISGAWIGSFFANSERWNEMPAHLQTLFRLCMDSSHYYRQWWYWGGEARLRTSGTKLKLTTIPADQWAEVEKAALEFWDEIAKSSPRSAKIVKIFKEYNAVMTKAGPPYRA